MDIPSRSKAGDAHPQPTEQRQQPDHATDAPAAEALEGTDLDLLEERLRGTPSKPRRDKHGRRSWQDVLIREWRYSDDRRCADHLFELVADELVARGGVGEPVLAGGVYGVLAAMLSAVVASAVLSASAPAHLQEACDLCLGIGVCLAAGAAFGSGIMYALGHFFTWRRLKSKAKRLFCPKCLVRPHKHRAPLPLRKDYWYLGCRTCRRTTDLAEWAGTMVAVLDDRMDEAHLCEGNAMRINWLKRGEPFDFDSIEILSASDQDVERFAMLAANDTDDYRRKRYRRIPCRVSAGCDLGADTIRMLEQTFGEVTRGPEGDR